VVFKYNDGKWTKIILETLKKETRIQEQNCIKGIPQEKEL
jgi:hypothetical protein